MGPKGSGCRYDCYVNRIILTCGRNLSKLHGRLKNDGRWIQTFETCRFRGPSMTNLPQTPTNTLAGKMDKHAPLPVMPTRRGHGGLAWSLPLGEPEMRQPQDGAVEKRKRLAMIDAKLHSNVLNEPEDARLTGGTRSLTRRLMGLNVTAVTRRGPKATTGSASRTDVA